MSSQLPPPDTAARDEVPIRAEHVGHSEWIGVELFLVRVRKTITQRVVLKRDRSTSCTIVVFPKRFPGVIGAHSIP